MMTMVGILLGGVGVLSIAGLVTLLLGKASASLRHLVWTATLAALVAIPVLEASGFRIEVAVPAKLIEASSAVKVESESVAVVVVDPSTPRSEVPEGDAGPVVTASEGVDRRLEAGLGAGSPDRVARTGDWNIGRLVAGVWAVGFLLLLVQTALSHVAARRLTVHNVRCCSTLALQRLTRLSVELGIKRPVWLVVSSTIRVPATWGFRRSTVVLPFAYESWSRETLDRVLVHELAHVHRRDSWSHLLAELARAVHWPNPLVWLALHRQRLESERACDDQVLGRGSAATAYAEDLLTMVRALRAESKLPRAALAMADQSGAGGRVRAILDPKQARGRVGRLTVLVAGALTISLAAATTVVTPVAVAQELPVLSSAPPLTPAIRVLEADTEVSAPAPALSRQMVGDVGQGERSATRVEEVMSTLTDAVPAPDPVVPDELDNLDPTRPRTVPGPSRPRFTPMMVRPRVRNLADVQKALMKEYRPLLRDDGIEGQVEVWFFISEEGRVLDTRVSQSSGHTVLDEAAVKVADVFRFTPALNRNARVAVWIRLTITFEVQEVEK